MLTRYSVTGLTCNHCVAHVIEEVAHLPGVDQVDLNLDGSMAISSQAPLEFDLVRKAVAEAGDYGLDTADL